MHPALTPASQAGTIIILLRDLVVFITLRHVKRNSFIIIIIIIITRFTYPRGMEGRVNLGSSQAVLDSLTPEGWKAELI